MHDVFISYARGEFEKTRQIRQVLQQVGLKVFFDTESLDGGDEFPDIIDKALKSAGAVVSLWSPHALSRPWVRKECRVAQMRGVLVPVIIEPIDPVNDVPTEFVGVHYLDLVGFDGDKHHPGFGLLLRALAHILKREDLLQLAERDPVTLKSAEQTSSAAPNRVPGSRGADLRYEWFIDLMESVNGGRRRVTIEGKTLEVTIPKGVEERRVLRLRGQGAPGEAGGPAGDLLLEIRFQPHPVFRREGDDVHMDLPISLAEAVRGATVLIPTLEGGAALTVPPRSNTGRVLRLRGKGVGGQGDQFVRLLITLPDKDDPALDDFIGHWRDRDVTPPRPAP